jgi:hypothetical protein
MMQFVLGILLLFAGVGGMESMPDAELKIFAIQLASVVLGLFLMLNSIPKEK